jgi:precorrin-6B C5,15-methyltransferase / cobalt-precorrin-6B C5,C15-methyltransferase
MAKVKLRKTSTQSLQDRCIDVVGMGLSPDDLTPGHRGIIARADILIGGRRLLDYFRDSPAQKKVIDKDIEAVVAYIRRRLGRRTIVVLASGDPLFFGIGTKLLEAFGPDRVAIHPNVSSVAAAFARIKEPWDGVRVISLHGRENESDLLKALAEEDRVAVLTDPERNPAWLARRVRETLGGGFRLAVMEALGTPSERHGWYALAEAAAMKFHEPNIALLKREPEAKTGRGPLCLGTPDDEFEHHRGLITKSEVRAVALSKLRLSPGQVLWDLGAGSGSVALEASLLLGKGRIVAVEQKPERIDQIKANARRFNVRNLSVVQAVLPAGLAQLPKPDRIFIGGGGKNLGRIITAAARYLRPDGRIVINTVLLPNVNTARDTLKALGFGIELIQVQIYRSQEMPWAERLEALNPVWIVTGRRRGEGGSGKKK